MCFVMLIVCLRRGWMRGLGGCGRYGGFFFCLFLFLFLGFRVGVGDGSFFVLEGMGCRDDGEGVMMVVMMIMRWGDGQGMRAG